MSPLTLALSLRGRGKSPPHPGPLPPGEREVSPLTLVLSLRGRGKSPPSPWSSPSGGEGRVDMARLQILFDQGWCLAQGICQFSRRFCARLGQVWFATPSSVSQRGHEIDHFSRFDFAGNQDGRKRRTRTTLSRSARPPARPGPDRAASVTNLQGF